MFPMNVVTCQTYLSRPFNRADVVVIHEVMTTILPFLNQAQKNSLEFTGAVVWNSTPIEIRKS